MRFINFEYHPNDSRVRLETDGICQSLTSRMGTGGGNVPIVMEIRDDSDGKTLFRHKDLRHGNRSDP